MKFMKKFSYLILFVLTCSGMIAQKNISGENNLLVNGKMNNDQMTGFTIKDIIPLVLNNGDTAGYINNLYPEGYIVTTVNKKLPPVIAYSYKNNVDTEGKFFNLLITDLEYRTGNIPNIPENILNKRYQTRMNLISGTQSKDPLFDQWPPAGSTSTEGWLETNWNQTAPYNAKCPMDPVTVVRSYAGCPAVAMAMIVNFHASLNAVYFDDTDDYYHNYAGRQYWIDDSSFTIKFPSFPELNLLLDTLELHYQNSTPLTNTDIASLIFACGVAATQVYTSSGSGTFGVDQALEAYQKFNYPYVELLLETDPDLYQRIINNIIDTLPVHLAVVDQAWSTGHNVVIDGYNTDNYFHLNFGWGGSTNGWYLLPDEIPYGLTVVEGAIVNIRMDSPALTDNRISEKLLIYPNPANDYLYINHSLNNSRPLYKIYNSEGALIDQNMLAGDKISIASLNSGIYLLILVTDEGIHKELLVKM